MKAIRAMFSGPSRRVVAGLLLILLSPLALAQSLDTGIAGVQHAWVEAYYQAPDADKNARFESLMQQAQGLVRQYPDRAEPLVWLGIVESSAARFKGGLGALKLAKDARQQLLAAEKIDPNALNGSIYTSLGSLYAKVPGWPIGFGDKDKARGYFQNALAINPDGIDPNYFYGDFLHDSGDDVLARKYLEKALAAPGRPGRADADAARRQEVKAALAQLEPAAR